MTAARFFLHRPAAPRLYTLSLHDALPISVALKPVDRLESLDEGVLGQVRGVLPVGGEIVHDPENALAVFEDQPVKSRSEEHTSELQSLRHLVCRLLLEKTKCSSRRTDQRR